MLYQPLKGSIAARFTRGRNIDDDVSDKVCSTYKTFTVLRLLLKYGSITIAQKGSSHYLCDKQDFE